VRGRRASLSSAENMPGRESTIRTLRSLRCYDYPLILFPAIEVSGLANPNKVAHIQRINRSLGLHVPRLVTPRAMIRRDEWASD
jgi:hypothetical protein